MLKSKFEPLLLLLQGIAAAGTLYEVLGLSPTSSAQEVRRAYRQRAACWHPDKWHCASPEQQRLAASTFERIQHAHDVLGDEQSRRVYDCGLR